MSSNTDTVPFDSPCGRCTGGHIPLLACPICADSASYSGKDDPGFLYRPYDLLRIKPGPRAPRPAQFPTGGERIALFPKCGHRVPDIADLAHRSRYAPPVLFEADCRFCGGTGLITRRLPAEEAAQREARRTEEARLAQKWMQTQAALLHLTLFGPRHLKPLRPPCEAKCRDGHPCRRGCVPGLLRCPRHRGRAKVPLVVQHWMDQQRRRKPEAVQMKEAITQELRS